MAAGSDPSATEEPSVGLVPYWIDTAVASANGVTDPVIVAPVLETAVAGPVVAIGEITIRPIASGERLSVNHSAPLGPARIESPSSRPVGLTPFVISVIWPEGVISATADGVIGSIEACGTHRLPSAPAVMSSGRSSLRPVVNSVIWPDGVTRPIAR